MCSKMKHLVIVLISFAHTFHPILPSPVDNGFVVTSTEANNNKEFSNKEAIQTNPSIYYMHIQSNVTNRFASTLVTSKVRNTDSKAAETTFSVILPENAFISHFEMEIAGKVYKAYVKEKTEAKKTYDSAVASGQSAGHVEMSARDSKTFTVSVNIEPESKTVFRLKYEELLQRKNGRYELVVNIHPGQIVDDLNVKVSINESRLLTFVKTPSLRTGNEISKNRAELFPSAKIEIINITSANVVFTPSIAQQKRFVHYLGGKEENGMAGQFIVQYDVERDPQGGEVLVRDGYFVHFFSPSGLQPLRKHVVFVLDHSGSMDGRKFDQLTEAMKKILSQLNSEDMFNIVRFSSDALVWNSEENKFMPVLLTSNEYGSLEPYLRELNLFPAVKATKNNIVKAMLVIEDSNAMGMTNIMIGLEVGLFLIKRNQERFPKDYQPILIFLTDGQANEGVSDPDDIVKITNKLNSGEDRTAIFSLSFGQDADKKMLRKISAKNLGFSRHIYEASDASLQLQDFYNSVASPILSDVTFKYVDTATAITKTHYPFLFGGSELVVAGKIADSNPNILSNVIGTGSNGLVKFNRSETQPVSSLERLWAYLTVKQILDKREDAEDKDELTQEALDLALRYSFVTPVSSLVVVKPNQTTAVETKRADNIRSERGFAVGRSFSPYSLGSSRFQSNTMLSRRMYMPSVYRARSFGFMVYHSAPETTTPKLKVANPAFPPWLQRIQTNSGVITTPQGFFKLGNRGDVSTYSVCRTPQNTSGICTLLSGCVRVVSTLTDLNVYLQYFCPLNEYAGVCCPVFD